MLLGLGKTLTFGQQKIYPYATGGDYVYLYEEGNKTYRVHEFHTTGTSTLNVEVGGQVEYLVVGGGGGGAQFFGGGGGAGGVLTGTTALQAQSYAVTIGSGGGSGGLTNGSNTTALGLTALGGGLGGIRGVTGYNGGSGGGGGGGGGPLPGGSGTSGQGNDGGDGSSGSGNIKAGGGGGGAGSVGSNAVPSVGGNGGDGIEWPVGSGNYYGGGGGGGGGSTAGTGGLGGGGDGVLSNPALSGVANTGGGGGGNAQSGGSAGVGGSGIVIVRYVIAEKKLWTPSELGSSVAAWYDADDSSTITLNGSNVSQWSDKSGNGKHAIQNNSSLQPAYTTAGLNNRNVVTLTQDELAVTNLVLTGQGHEVYIIATLESTSDYWARLFSFKTTGQSTDYANSTSWVPVYKSGASVQLGAYQQSSTTLYTTTYGTPMLISSTISSGLTVRVNGVVEGTKATSTDLNTTAGLLIGESFQTISENWDGIVGEIVFTDELSTADRQKMEGYLAHKWGLTNNLPSGHPYKYEPPYKVEPEEIVTDGLVLNLDAGDYASYPRSGTTWYDISGNGLTGALTNGPTYDSANKGSIVFDGSNDYVDVSSTTPTSLQGNPSFTVEGWFKKSGSWSSGSVWGLGGGTNLQGINSFNSSGTDEISIDLWGTSTYTTNIQYSSTEWKHVAWTYYGQGFTTSNIIIYINGVAYTGNDLEVLRGGSGTPNINNNGIVLGRAGRTINNYYGKPIIGNFRIYSKVLSTTEIAQNFNALCGRYGIPPIATPSVSIVTSGLVLYLDASNENSYPETGTTWFDLSPSENDGTLVGSPAYNPYGALFFRGTASSQYVTIPHDATSMDFSNQQTICMWMLPLTDEVANRRNPYNQAYGGPGTLTHETDGTINYYFGTNGGNSQPYVSKNSGFTVADNELAFITVTRNQTTNSVKWYKNGSFVTSSNAGGYASTANGTNPILIGDGYERGFLGNIYFCAVYNRELSATEVYQNYIFGKERYEKNLTGWAKFGEGLQSEGLNSYSFGTTVDYTSSEGGSLVFNGTTDSYMDFSASVGSTTTSVEMWVKLDSDYSNKMFFGWSTYDVFCGSGNIGFNTGNGDIYGISSATVASLGLTGNWKHYVFEMRSDVSYTNNKIYINGVSQTLSQQTGTENAGNRTFNSGDGRIAGWLYDTAYRMKMNCAVFKVYNRALSSTEIQQNYDALKGRYGL